MEQESRGVGAGEDASGLGAGGGDGGAAGRGCEASPAAPAASGAAERAAASAERAAASDARIERMDRVAVLYAEITSATRAFLRALAESDRHRDWAEEGFGSCAEWLAWRLGITRNTANEKVRASRALEHLPRISEAMERGELSFTKVRALTRAATPDNEAELLTYARAGSAASLERLIRGWKTLEREGELKRERLLHRSRSFSVFAGEDGTYVVRGRLMPEVAAVLMRAIEAAGDALFAAGCEAVDEADEVEPAQRRADAIGLLAERALAVGFGGRGAGREDGRGARAGAGAGGTSGGDRDRASGADSDGGATIPAPSVPISGARAERYQVVVHVDASTLRAHAEPGRSELDDGTRVTAETARRLACDASLVALVESVDGEVLAAGRRTRSIPPAVRRALEARDRCCRFPGCGLRFTDCHHIEHWADGGPTILSNLVLLCRRHHRLVHEGGIRVCSDREGRIVFFTPSGRVLHDAPPPPVLADEDGLAALIRRNRVRGIEPDASAAQPGWRYDRDVPWALEAAAWDALDRGEVEGDGRRADALDGDALDRDALNADALEGDEAEGADKGEAEPGGGGRAA